MTRHQEPMTTRSTALLQQIEGGVLGRYRSCLFSGHDTPPAQLTLPLPSVYHLHSQFPTLVFFCQLIQILLSYCFHHSISGFQDCLLVLIKYFPKCIWTCKCF